VILVDTSVWIDHLRQSDSQLVAILEHGEALIHPFVVGELALGSTRGSLLVEALSGLAGLPAASDSDVLAFIATYRLAGAGIGYVDAHLLFAAHASGARLLTRDRRLNAVADRLGLAVRGS
jgi:predicted nucleic acid-binding protein